MRKIIVSMFLSMDGVIQAPGGPEEDRAGGFEWGGWIFHYEDEGTNRAMSELLSQPFDLLLGRRTYEIFAAHWPYQDDEIGRKFNRIKKYVVATTPVDTSWENSILINCNVVQELKKLKETAGPDLLVHGSSVLVQALLANELVDVLHTLTYPITIGAGKRLFDDGTQPRQWKVTQSSISPTGVFIARYEPDGNLNQGSFIPDKPSEAELRRRERWADENS